MSELADAAEVGGLERDRDEAVLADVVAARGAGDLLEELVAALGMMKSSVAIWISSDLAPVIGPRCCGSTASMNQRATVMNRRPRSSRA